MTRLYLLVAGLWTLTACEILAEDACDRYADYICTCHADDPDFDCDALIDLATDPEPDVVDQCQSDLSTQRADDQATGFECAA